MAYADKATSAIRTWPASAHPAAAVSKAIQHTITAASSGAIQNMRKGATPPRARNAPARRKARPESSLLRTKSRSASAEGAAARVANGRAEVIPASAVPRSSSRTKRANAASWSGRAAARRTR